MDYQKLDVMSGEFALDQKRAIEYLRAQVGALFEEAIAGKDEGYGCGLAPDTASSIFEELICMAQQIKDNDWRFVLFGEASEMRDSKMFVQELAPVEK